MALVAMLSLSGCKAVECGKYYRLASDGESYLAVREWADREVFGRSFTESDLRSGSLIGPGRRAISRKIGMNLPEELVGSEVRILGQDWENPDAIFIGKVRFQGIVVTRNGMSESLAAVGLSPKLLDSAKERIAVMCYQESENMSEK
ncbi:hypothetical protein V9L00_04320 [Pseudoxanthomonas sp. CCNWLW206]